MWQVINLCIWNESKKHIERNYWISFFVLEDFVMEEVASLSVNTPVGFPVPVLKVIYEY